MPKSRKSDSEKDDTLNFVDIPLIGKWRPAIRAEEMSEGDFSVLSNMRYGEVTPKSVSGMTKINTAVVNATNLKIRNGFHFKKEKPSESHVLVQAWNAGLTTSKLYDNSTAIPAQGNFTATEIWSDTSGATQGKFSNAPDGCLAYCNGEETNVWGGNESRVPAFIVGTYNEVVKYDFTEEINNTINDVNNRAYFGVDSGTIDSYTKLLLHFDNNDDDSSAGTHNLTPAGSPVYSTSSKFGTHCITFDGTDDYFTTPDHADYNLNVSDIWTIDFWVKTNITANGSYCVYGQRTDANNYCKVTVEKTATGMSACFTVFDGGVSTVSIDTTECLTDATWHHIAFVQDSTTYYGFVDGQLKIQTTDANSAENYSGALYIGANHATGTVANFFSGNIDEFRLSNGIARWTTSFSPEGVPYGTDACYVYVGSLRPIQAIKIYLSTYNTSAATASGQYWANSKWNSLLSFVDGTRDTATLTKTLAQDGTITFTSTVGTATAKTINRVYCYWYRFVFSGIGLTHSYHVTLDAPMQNITDLWDGMPRTVTSFYKHTTSDIDNIIQVSQEDYLSTDALTFCDTGSLTSTQYLLAGFSERMTGFEVTFGETAFNTTACNMTVYYWNGTAWVALGGLTDGTKSGSKSFGQNGIVTWDSPNKYSEFKTNVSNGELWWYYKIAFSATLSAGVSIDYITGIATQKTITAYKYPVMWQNRLWLLNKLDGDKNSAICSSAYTVVVFNGSDSGTFLFGNEGEITSGATLFTRFGNSIYDNLIVLKKDEVWVVDGTTPGNYALYKIADKFGCVSPDTLISCDMGYEIAPGLSKHILIWQSAGAVIVFDGNTIMPVSQDIENYFDPSKTECIVSSYIDASKAFFDEARFEYHLLIVSGSGATTRNVELVYDLRKKKWFKIDRGTGKYLQCGFSVRDTTGNAYTYGGIDTGYVERLENGTTFDGNSITSNLKTSNVPLGDWFRQTKIRYIKHLASAKTTTTQSVTVTHYPDSASSSTETASMTVTASGKGISQAHKTVNWDSSAVFHAFDCSITTTNETIGYEPLGLAVGFRVTREDIY